MTNAEVYGALALILIELQKINERLDTVYDSMIDTTEPIQFDIEFPTLLKGTYD